MARKVRIYLSLKEKGDEDDMYPQHVLQMMAAKIRENCECEDIFDGQKDGTTSHTYINHNLGIEYFIKDQFGEIQIIIEERSTTNEEMK